MKCEQCAADGRDVNMEALGGGQFQCPDCRFCAVDEPLAPVEAPAPPSPVETETPTFDEEHDAKREASSVSAVKTSTEK